MWKSGCRTMPTARLPHGVWRRFRLSIPMVRFERQTACRNQTQGGVALYLGYEPTMGITPVSAVIDRRWTKRADLLLLLLMAAAICLGLVALRSIGLGGAPQFFKKQLVWLALGSLGLLCGALIDCERVGRFARLMYWLNLLLLAAVLLFGHESKGAVRWFGTETYRIQPSELAKLLVILSLAALFAQNAERVRHPGLFVRSVIHMLAPLLLVLKQPDLGTGLVLVAVWMGISFIVGMPFRYHVIFLVGAALAFGLAVKVGVVHDYQMQRLVAFVNPDADPQGAGYQVKQARIAIGSGRVQGKGFGQGTQSHGRFIPERQTDFIFTVLAEEGGFVLGVIAVAVYAGLLLRGWTIAMQTQDVTSRLVAAGVLSMLGFHVLVNLGMTMGLMPVTGVPLPFMSYGGSSLIVSMTGIGLLIGISMRRDALVF